MQKIIISFLMLIGTLFASEEKIIKSIAILDEFMTISGETIPSEILLDTEAIAIIPDMVRFGIIVGGAYGEGILMIKTRDEKWSNPLFVKLGGGSYGWQLGAENADIILLFKEKKTVNELLSNKITLGIDTSIAIGPFGRNFKAATDVSLNAEIYSYSKSAGFYMGLSLEGMVLNIDKDKCFKYYQETTIKNLILKNSNNEYIKILKDKLYEYLH
jgi:lipid-binding SYLF domain-containing protein